MFAYFFVVVGFNPIEDPYFPKMDYFDISISYKHRIDRGRNRAVPSEEKWLTSFKIVKESHLFR